MRGRVTEPILDDTGNIIGLRGHKIDRHGEGPAIVVIGAEEPTTEETEHTQNKVAKLSLIHI